MEPVNEPLDRLLPVNNGAMTPSMMQSEVLLVEELGVLLKQMRDLYANQEISTETSTMWLLLWRDQASLHGLPRFKKALYACFKGRLFMPQPADIEKELNDLQNATEHYVPTDKYMPCKVCADCTCVELNVSPQGLLTELGFIEVLGARSGKTIQVPNNRNLDRKAKCYEAWRAARPA